MHQNVFMTPLNLPNFEKELNIDWEGKLIFDPFRKKKVSLTPEEWVRQNFLKHMVKNLGFPAGLLSVEMPLTLNGLTRRCDIVAFDNTAKPRLIVECKAASIKITQKTFTQIATYNLKLNVDFLMVTNGLNHYCCLIDYKNNKYSFLEELPSFEQVVNFNL